MKDSEAWRKLAEQLMSRPNSYFNWKPKDMPKLAGWLRHGSCCVYCGKDLMETWESLFGSAHTEHLLPYKNYKELADDDLNLALCCSVCNSLKHNYNANEYLSEGLRYRSGAHLTEDQHAAILRLCKNHVDKKRAEEKSIVEKGISDWKALVHTASV
jgi:hypothetical protein